MKTREENVKEKLKKRSKNLDDQVILSIVEILDGWKGKLTWNLLIDEIEKRLYQRYTRQALFAHERIRNAFDLKKEDIPFVLDNGRKKCGPEAVMENERHNRLLSENERLKSENQRLLEQFNRWAYNAYTRGLTPEFLNQPLPVINRA